MKRFLVAVTAVIAVALASVVVVPPAQAVTYTASSPNSFKNIATNTTTAVLSGSGTLDSIVINTTGATANTITVYDNTAGSGTKIATIDGTTASGTRIIFNVKVSTGITVVTASGTAANITVVYRSGS